MAIMVFICEKCGTWFELPFKEENFDVCLCEKCKLIDKIMPWLLGIGWVVVIIVGIALSLASAADLIDIIPKEGEK